MINARRHPFDSCLGAYKQLFGKGQHFTYDMAELADYYRKYHETMQHWHRVLPGKVLDVHYEETVTDLETQVRRILAHCGLPFEEACLRFHETDRAVKTASSEQVRQPIYTRALGYWRHYDEASRDLEGGARGHHRRAAGDRARRGARSAVRPDLEAVDGVADVHRQVDRQEPPVRRQVVHRNGRRRGAAGDDRVGQHAEPARKALAGDAALVQSVFRSAAGS